MSESPASSCSPVQPPLRLCADRLCSPPAMVSLGSGLHTHRSRPPGTESIIGQMPDEDDDVRLSYVYRSSKYEAGSVRGRGGLGGSSSSRTRAGTGAGNSGGANSGGTGASMTVGGTDRSGVLSPHSLQRQGSFYMHSGMPAYDESIMVGDMGELPIHYGPVGSSSSFTRPSSTAPTARGGSTTSTSAAPSVSSATARAVSPSFDGVGVPPAMLQAPRRPQTQRATNTGTGSAPNATTGSSPMAAAVSARRLSGGATPSTVTGPDGRPLDSILMSSSQVASATASPSREAAAKRSFRFHSRESVTNHSGVGDDQQSPMAGLTSPSTAGQRKKVSLPAEDCGPFTHRSIESVGSGSTDGHGSSSGFLSMPRNVGPTPKSIHVNLAHKALIGKGSYGMVFKAMDRDTNQLIAVKEIKLAGTGNGSRCASSSNSGCSARGPTTGEDVVVGSSNNSATRASSSPGGGDRSASGGVASRSPPKSGGRSSEFNKQLEAVRRELAVLKQLDHPNIVKCLGEECDDSHLRIYMELVAGGSVSSLLRTFGSFEERQASNFTRQMLEGLQYLHSRGIVHRDLKGDNLLVDTSGTLKLADFGTARDMHAQTLTNTIVGTAYFMAPETILSQSSGVKADIWSVGCCVIEMLTGRPPLSNLPNQYSIMMFIAEAKDGLLEKYIPVDSNWSDDAIDFLKKCLNMNPDKRPSAQQLLSHRWITNPTRHDAPRSPESTVLTTTAIAYASLPSPLPLDRVRSGSCEGGAGVMMGSPTVTDLESLTPTSERGKKMKRDRKAKREREKDRKKSSSASGDGARSSAASSVKGRKGLEEYNLTEVDLMSLSGGGGGRGESSSAMGPRLTSPRRLAKEKRRSEGNRQQPQPQPQPLSAPRALAGAEPLPEIRTHSSTATSARSPFLPSLAGDRTPSSAHAVVKSNSSSQRGIFAESSVGRRNAGAGGKISSGSRGSGCDVMSAKGSSHLTKSPASSKETETPRHDGIADDVLMSTREDSMRYVAGSGRVLAITSPPQSAKRMKMMASPRIPPLPSPTSRRK